jgi:hypothetical protein
MPIAPATSGSYTSNSATIFSLVAPKDGNNVYHSVNNGYASINKPMLVLTTYTSAAAPALSPSTRTPDHWRKELDKKISRPPELSIVNNSKSTREQTNRGANSSPKTSTNDNIHCIW